MDRYCDPRSLCSLDVAAVASAGGDGHVEGVEGEVGAQRARRPPAQHAPRVGVDRERHVHEPAAGAHPGEVREPQPVGCVDAEVSVHQVLGKAVVAGGGGRAGLCAAHHASKTHLCHQPLHGERATRTPLTRLRWSAPSPPRRRRSSPHAPWRSTGEARRRAQLSQTAHASSLRNRSTGRSRRRAR